MTTATVSTKDIPVTHSIRNDVNREFLTVDCPDGWDDVKKIAKKVLVYEGRKFTFTGWSSDSNQAFFAKPLNMESSFARIQ
jgi:hypothetical protein